MNIIVMRAVFITFVLALVSTVNCGLSEDAAMIETTFKGVVGFLLDEIPPEVLHDAINYIKKEVTDEHWRQRAELQIKNTLYHQVYRVSYLVDRHQLTLPPIQTWKIKFVCEPYKVVYQEHTMIVRDYEFYGVLIGKADTLPNSEPLLTYINGTFTSTFVVPLDPEHVFQRIEYACADESSYPIDSVNSENYWIFFDFYCSTEIEKPFEERTIEDNLNNCHWTDFPDQSCIKELRDKVGAVDLTIRWKRIPWSDSLYQTYKYGEQTSESADLKGELNRLTEDINFIYKYFESTSCSLDAVNPPGCVKASGWRHLLRFTTSTLNVGKEDLFIGNLNDEYKDKNFFMEDTCRKYNRFDHFANVHFDDQTNSLAAFCMQTSWRYHNNEFTWFSTPYDTCYVQGISPGWGDDYIQGVDCQWVDVTDIEAGTYDLKVLTNPDKFLCEGKRETNEDGSTKWVESDFELSDGTPVERPDCEFDDGYDSNNQDKVSVKFDGKTQSLVTSPCKRSATLSPTKDCGFQLIKDNIACDIGNPSKVTVKNLDAKSTAVIRICESSVVLGHSVFCEYSEKVTNDVVLPGTTKEISFICPPERDASEPGGVISVLVSSLIPNQPVPSVEIF